MVTHQHPDRNRCSNCGHPIHTAVSIARGLGPACWRSLARHALTKAAA